MTWDTPVLLPMLYMSACWIYFDDELVKLGAETIKVPRTNYSYAGVLQKARLLPKISWRAWKTAYSAAYKSYKAQINKKSYPCTKSSPIVSRMAERSTPSGDTADKDASGANKAKPEACRWCKSTEHNTCDCPRLVKADEQLAFARRIRGASAGRVLPTASIYTSRIQMG